MNTDPRFALPLHIDSTMISCFRSCPQKFLLEFARGFRPPGISIDLHAGACFASAMENVYREIWIGNKPIEEALRISLAKYLIQWGDFEIPPQKKTAKTKDRVWEAVEDYFTQYPPRTDHVQPYFLNGEPTFEFTFAIPLEGDEWPRHPSGEPFLYSGRFDMLGSYADRPCVRDEKTTGGSISTGWSEKWDLRNQFLGYVWACQQSGLDLDTVVVRGIAIQKTQIVHAEAVKIYTNSLVERWLEQTRRDLWRMVKCHDEGYFDYNLADACTQFGSCIFVPVCQSPNSELWVNQFEVRHWNPLAKDPTEQSALVPMSADTSSSLVNASGVPMATPASPTPFPGLGGTSTSPGERSGNVVHNEGGR